MAVYAVGAEAKQPNFLVVLGEAQGWASSSVQMDDVAPDSKSSLARTPALESIARDGMRVAKFYAASPRCSGHLKVRVDGGTATLEYVRACLPADETPTRRNGSISDRYEMHPR